jgi:hypothetical protein
MQNELFCIYAMRRWRSINYFGGTKRRILNENLETSYIYWHFGILAFLAVTIALIACDNGNDTTTKDNDPKAVVNVYISGSYWKDSNNQVPCYWKDGIKTDLPNGVESGRSEARSIIESGSSIYVAGYYWEGTKYIACYWKDGVKTDLPEETEGAGTYAITVSGELVYVAGYYREGTNYFACYWKDGIKTNLSAGDREFLCLWNH